jgi:L-ascorbate metabolism protein UlaG (beta-lactamase superfamily)
MKKKILFAALLAVAGLVLFLAGWGDPVASSGERRLASDHFDGEVFFNPVIQPGASKPGPEPRRGFARFVWRWILSDDWPRWPEAAVARPGPTPPARVPPGEVRVTPVGHATFLIQMDGLNILTDPTWSERCSPVSWAGPKRHQAPGLRFEDLPPIDLLLVSHNHYDHLDLPTLERLAGKGVRRAITPLKNADLIRGAGLPEVRELDWWQSVPVSAAVTVTLVPAQHFSSRTLWDRNHSLWGGFVVSGPSGHVYFAGDTGYGPHFREIARRFAPIRIALLPISPYSPGEGKDGTRLRIAAVHMGPAEAVQAHQDLEADVSVASHFQVFQLGWDGFDEAVNELGATLKRRDLSAGAFLVPTFGQTIVLSPESREAKRPQRLVGG